MRTKRSGCSASAYTSHLRTSYSSSTRWNRTSRAFLLRRSGERRPRIPRPSKRDQLVEATEELLWEVGYEAMSPRDIQVRSVAKPGSLRSRKFLQALWGACVAEGLQSPPVKDAFIVQAVELLDPFAT